MEGEETGGGEMGVSEAQNNIGGMMDDTVTGKGRAFRLLTGPPLTNPWTVHTQINK